MVHLDVKQINRSINSLSEPSSGGCVKGMVLQKSFCIENICNISILGGLLCEGLTLMAL